MAETTVETLESVMRELSELSDNFALSGGLMYCYGSNKAKEWIPISGQDDWRDNSRLLMACMEEIWTLGWYCQINIDPDAPESARVEVFILHDWRVLGSAHANSPGLAISTALRNARKANQPSHES